MIFNVSKSVKLDSGTVAKELFPRFKLTTFTNASKPVKLLIVLPVSVKFVTACASESRIFPFSPLVSIIKSINLCSKFTSGIAVVCAFNFMHKTKLDTSNNCLKLICSNLKKQK